jgi:hypothetical protein
MNLMNDEWNVTSSFTYPLEHSIILKLIEMAWAWERNIILHLSFGAFHHPQTN